MTKFTLPIAAAIALAAALVFAAATPASAHNFVVESTPAEGEVLTELPEAWAVVTNETMLDAGDDAVFGLWARDADGLFYGDGCVDVSGNRMSAAPVIGVAGDYTLVYALVSADGHPLTGEIPFEWAPTDTAEVANGSAEPTRCGAAAAEPEAAETASNDASWIAAAVGVAAAVGAAVIAAVLLTRRRKRRDDPAAT